MPRWEAPDHTRRPLSESQKRRLAEALAQGGMPRLFWPGMQRLVEELCAEAVDRALGFGEVSLSLKDSG